MLSREGIEQIFSPLRQFLKLQTSDEIERLTWDDFCMSRKCQSTKFEALKQFHEKQTFEINDEWTAEI